MRRTAPYSAVLLLTVLLSVSCSDNSVTSKHNYETAVIWTDCAEFVSYAELFNKQHDNCKVVAEYRENVALALSKEKEHPDIVVGAWLKGEKTRHYLQKLNSLFGRNGFEESDFYPELLALGKAGNAQYLLPVSFNLPAIMFHSDNVQLAATDFVLPLETIRKEGAAFNKQKNGMYTNIGFLPRYNHDFLYTIAVLFGTSFKEGGAQFSWNQNSLLDSIDYIKTWIRENNTSVQQEDDFVFKYMYEPEHMLITNKRILMAYISSKDLFLIPRDKSENIDFRWLAKKESIPVEDKIEYMGICTKTKHSDVARTFLKWFFQAKNQEAMIRRFFDFDMQEQTFGIMNGFSSIRSVNEDIMPKFYPRLIGHLPRLNALLSPEILPADWQSIKKDIVYPYIEESITAESQATVTTLGVRIEDRKKIQN